MKKYTILEVLTIVITITVCIIFSSSAIAGHGKGPKKDRQRIERKYEK